MFYNHEYNSNKYIILHTQTTIPILKNLYNIIKANGILNNFHNNVQSEQCILFARVISDIDSKE